MLALPGFCPPFCGVYVKINSVDRICEGKGNGVRLVEKKGERKHVLYLDSSVSAHISFFASWHIESSLIGTPSVGSRSCALAQPLTFGACRSVTKRLFLAPIFQIGVICR